MRKSFFSRGEYRPFVSMDEENDYDNNKDHIPTGFQRAIALRWKMLLIVTCVFSASIGYIGRGSFSDNGGSVSISPTHFAAVHPIQKDDVSAESGW